MSAAHRVSKSGSYRIDRQFKGVGRIALASGTQDKRTFRKLDVMLTELHESGHVDVLKAIRDRRVSLQEVYQARRAGNLTYLAGDLVLLRNLWDSVDQWIPRSAKAKQSRRRYATSWGSLRRSGSISAHATVQDLAAVDWRALRDAWEAGPADWNRMRAAVSRFLTVTLGDKYHPFRREVIHPDRFPLADEPEGRVPDLPPVRFWELVEACDERIRDSIVCLAVTGMRVGEYMALEPHHLLPHTHQIRVPGTKTRRSRDTIRVGPEAWGWVEAAVPSPLRYGWLRKWFKRAASKIGQPELTLHDLRHLRGQVLSEAGMPEAQIAVALRHTDLRTTRRYTRQRDHGKAAEAIDLHLLKGGGS